MRNFKTFVTDVARKPPQIMPFVAIAHVLWLVYTIWGLRYISVSSIEWLQVLWLLAYTTCWVAACDLRRWGALTYILLTLANTSLYLLLHTVYEREAYMSSLFLLDGMFSFYLLLFYKRFNG
jgi:hypothetical protein